MTNCNKFITAAEYLVTDSTVFVTGMERVVTDSMGFITGIEPIITAKHKKTEKPNQLFRSFN